MTDLGVLSPLELGDLELNNRVFLAPLTRARCDENGVQQFGAEYYTQRSGAGLMISEGTHISQQGAGWHCAPGIYTDAQLEAWKKVTLAVRENGRGAKFFLQLWHLGRFCHSDVTGGAIVSASEVPLPDPVNVKWGEKKEPQIPHALTKEEIAQVVEDYGLAAERAMAAGFDGVEIHNANGYLPDQFLQSCTNKRTDEFGGSIENRLRFTKQIIDRIIKGGVPAKRIGIRFSPNGSFGGMGSADNVETFSAAFKLCAERGLGYVHVMDGLGFGFHKLTEPFTLAMVREIVKDKTLIVGNVGYTKELADERIAAGDADAIAFGRPYIGNPDLAERFAAGVDLAESKMEHWWSAKLGAEGYTSYAFAT